jgi:hypothetical protein
MKKQKPKLALISPANPPAPPATLGETGSTLWEALQTEHRIFDCDGLEMLAQICSAADRAAECAAIIAREGLVVSTAHGPKDHPLVKHELAARAFVVRSLAKLSPRHRVGRPGYGGLGIGWEDLDR